MSKPWIDEKDLTPAGAPWWTNSRAFGLCPMVCPDHYRHCNNIHDGKDDNLGPHACDLCKR
jgi:hypothetical protein